MLVTRKRNELVHHFLNSKIWYGYWCNASQPIKVHNILTNKEQYSWTIGFGRSHLFQDSYSTKLRDVCKKTYILMSSLSLSPQNPGVCLTTHHPAMAAKLLSLPVVVHADQARVVCTSSPLECFPMVGTSEASKVGYEKVIGVLSSVKTATTIRFWKLDIYLLPFCFLQLKISFKDLKPLGITTNLQKG